MTPHDQGNRPQGDPNEAAEPAPVIRDRRRLDPESGEVRPQAAQSGFDTAPPAGAASGAAAGATPPAESGAASSGAGESVGEVPSGADEKALSDAAAALAAERLADLQRLQAEYVNYRKRVERDRKLARDNAIGDVIEALMPTLDEIALARQHGDLTEGTPFAAIADKLEGALGRFGLTRFGEAGEEFDPSVHEALMHQTSDEATTTQISMVMQPGYMLGERVLRAARVGVTGPE